MIRLLIAWIAESREVARTRRQLARLDAKALADIGLSEADVAAEIARPFWDRGAYDWNRQRPAARRAAPVRPCRETGNAEHA